MNSDKTQDIISKLYMRESWDEYLRHKKEAGYTSIAEIKEIEAYIEGGTFPVDVDKLLNDTPVPARKEIAKGGSLKKRVIYTYDEPVNIILKLIAFLLYRYDGIFSDNCYAFRRKTGAGDAIRYLKNRKCLSDKFFLKVDISNYFNSIDAERLILKLGFLKENDERLLELFERLLRDKRAIKNGEIIEEDRGAMAGVPVASFFANVYMMDVDRLFFESGDTYFRYSDDILIFADTEEELCKLRERLFSLIRDLGLNLNEDKLCYGKPGESYEFLGFTFDNGTIDISSNAKRKLMAKIRRKARALRRWGLGRNFSTDKAAKGFIRAMNRKLFTYDEDGFSWTGWYFPYINTDSSLHELDLYIQQYARYIISGKHRAANYRTRYETLKEWGYRSLVNEYYKFRERPDS